MLTSQNGDCLVPYLKLSCLVIIQYTCNACERTYLIIIHVQEDSWTCPDLY